MAFVKLIDNVIVQKQPNAQKGFVKAPDNVVCGMVKSGTKFVDPPKVKKEKTETYVDKRAAAYPEVGDQLDAIWKALNVLRLEGVELPQEADDVLGQVLAVKRKYPKKVAK